MQAAILTFSTIFIIPESPRWLIYHDADDKAQIALEKINRDQIDKEFVVAEHLARLQQSRDAERDANAREKPTWGDLFRGTTRRRLFCAVGILVGQQIGAALR